MPSQHKVMFRPRRLAHGNLFVSNLERSRNFYTQVCGLHEVFEEPPIKAVFLSNGSSHHDVALLEVMERERSGKGGHLQIPKGRGSRPGLNHFGWEMENEAQLVEAYHRALDTYISLHRTANHQVSHSVYLFDPEGNLHEFYADAADDWRQVWRPGNTEVLTGNWNPDASPPSEKPRYIAAPNLQPIPEAALPSRKVSHGVLVVSDFARMVSFYTDVAGLTLDHQAPDNSLALLSGSLSGRDLALLSANGKTSPGMHHLGFEVGSEEELKEAERRLESQGLKPEMIVDHPSKRAIFLKDPDGMLLEFYVKGNGSLQTLYDTGRYDPAYLV